MAQIPTTPGRSRMPGDVGSNQMIGGFVSAEDMGSNTYREYERLGRTIQGAGNTYMSWAIGKYNDTAESEMRTADSAYMEEFNKEKNQIMLAKGMEAVDVPQKIDEASKRLGEKYTSTLKTPLAKQLFEQKRMTFDRQNRESADAYVVTEMENYRVTSLEAENKALIDNITDKSARDMVFVDGMQKIKQNTAELNRGQPPEYIKQKQQEMASLAAGKRAAALAESQGAEKALEFLNEGVEQELSKEDFQALRSKYGKAMIADAKKDSENQMRQMGIRLGELYDSEIEIERALYDIEDKELADIARTEAMRIKKARSLSGEEARKDDKARANREEATRIAGAASNELEAQGMVDALEGVSEADREEIQKQAFARLKVKSAATETERKETKENDRARLIREEATRIAEAAKDKAEAQGMVDGLEGVSEKIRESIQKQAFSRMDIQSATTEAERKDAEEKLKEQEAESARVNAEAIGKMARDEADILDAVNALDDVTEAYRERVHKMALTQFKAKQTRQAREKAETLNQAMKTMEENGWSLVAISPDWDQDTQDKMREMAEKRQIIAAAPYRQEKALELAGMTREQLQTKINNGEWPQMRTDLGGEGTPEYNLVWKKAFEAESDMRELQTPLQHAQTRFNARGIGKDLYPAFLEKFEESLRQKALELDLDDVARVPRKDQDAIIDDLLEEKSVGYDEYGMYALKLLGRLIPLVRGNIDKPRFPSGYQFMDTGGMNDIVRPYLEDGDKFAGTLPNGNLVLQNQGGGLSVLTPTGRKVETNKDATMDDLVLDAYKTKDDPLMDAFKAAISDDVSLDAFNNATMDGI